MGYVGRAQGQVQKREIGYGHVKLGGVVCPVGFESNVLDCCHEFGDGVAFPKKTDEAGCAGGECPFEVVERAFLETQ